MLNFKKRNVNILNINNLAEQILKKMPHGLTKLEQARFVYIELGKMFSFDEEYWLGNSKTKKRIYTSSQKVKDFKDLKDNKIICVSLSNLYNSLLKKIGIDAMQQKDDGKNPHVHSVIIMDGVAYKADLQKDIKYIQARRKTAHFGQEEGTDTNISITEEQLQEMDAKLGYYYEGEQDLQNLISSIKEEIVKYENLEEKMSHILGKIAQYHDISKMGYVEKIGYYDSIINKVLTAKEKSKIYKSEMYVEQNEQRKYTRCISVQKRDGNFYRAIYSENKGEFLPIEDKKILELMEDGLRLCGVSKIPGLGRQSKNIEK